MRRYRFLLGGTLICAAGLIGQTGRESYRQAYDTWQEAQANLEREAGTGGTTLVSKADRAAAAVATFEAARAIYLRSAAQEAEQKRLLLQTPAKRPSPDLAPPAVADLASAELLTVTRTITRFTNDPDRGIQQLRQSLERERAALTALNSSIQGRQKTVAATSERIAALEQARGKTAEAFGDESSHVSEAVAQLEKEGKAWADYYEKLAQAIQLASVLPPVLNAPPAPRNDSVPKIPLARYVGAWTYPTVNGIFHGMQPEFVDLVVHEQNGHAEGTLFGRFKLPSGNATDPLVRFDFEGDFGSAASQRLTLVTSDGVKGFIELIPGPAFNLLEVNFQTDPQNNKIRAGNFILVKK
jgi:hypothetical protein